MKIIVNKINVRHNTMTYALRILYKNLLDNLRSVTYNSHIVQILVQYCANSYTIPGIVQYCTI